MSARPNPAPGQDGEHATFCRLCEAFCGLTAEVKDGKAIKIGPDRANPHSQGHLCVKGPAIADITYDPDRVIYPLKRVGGSGEFARVSWDEALSDIARRLGHIRGSYGADAIATYFGNPGAFSTDTFMSSQWFLGKLGSSKFYTAGSQDGNSRHLASYILYGVAFRNSIPDLPNTDFLIIIGANPLVSHGGLLTAPRMRHDLDAIAGRGRVVVIDPRRGETAERYEHIWIQPNSDIWLLAAMLRTVFDEGLEDREFLNTHTVGWERLRDAVSTVTVEEASVRTGIAVDTIRNLARDFAKTPRAAMYSRVGLCRGNFSTISNVLVDAFNMATGKFGRKGGSTFGAFPLKGGPEPLVGYGEHRTRIGNLPVVGGMMPSAVLADDILEPGEGQVRAMMLIAGNPVLSAPAGAHLARAFASLDLMISIDLYVTESNRFAHYVLPSATFLEKGDVPLIGLSHMPRPYLQYSPAVIEKTGEAREELAIFRDLAKRMGIGSIYPMKMMARLEKLGFSPTALDMVDMGVRLGPVGDRFGFRRGLSLKKLAKNDPHGVMLDMPLTYENWPAHIAYPDGKLRLWHDILEEEFARFAQERHAPPDTRLKLFSQRTLKSMNSWMHNAAKLVNSQTPTLLIHPEDAATRGVGNGSQVELRTEHGRVEVIAQLSDNVVKGAICYPHGWGHNGGWRRANQKPGANINLLLGHGPDVVEKVSGTTFIDGVPVDVTVLGAADQMQTQEMAAGE
ncbi:MAG TPA: molybdopterin-dependent oxidoreductase [Rhizomicrobium sp.]|nr:molybdopterin-dependent oxidoreductase [Rhizomicrobium sp.]